MAFTYTTDIPAAGNNPSNDQPNMKVNTNSINSIIAVDHAGFSDTNAGMHYLARFLNQTGLPAGLISGAAALYCNADPNSPNENEIFMSPGSTGNAYQLTRTNSANYATFATNTAYFVPISGTLSGGWTFLPGGMLLQYGLAGLNSGNKIVTFPIPFTKVPFSIQLTFVNGTAGTLNSTILTGSVTETSFTSVNGGNYYWTAIGV